MEIDEIINQFVATLPSTICRIIMQRCCLAYGLLNISNATTDVAALYGSILGSAADITIQSYECAKLIGVMELALQGESEEAFWRDLAAQHDAPIFNLSALQAPLIEQHRQAALTKFYEM